MTEPVSIKESQQTFSHEYGMYGRTAVIRLAEHNLQVDTIISNSIRLSFADPFKLWKINTSEPRTESLKEKLKLKLHLKSE